MSAKMHMLKVVVSERLTQVAEEITPQMDVDPLHLHTTTDVSLQRFTGGLVVVESCDDSPKQNHNISDPEEAFPRPEPSIKEEQEDEWSVGFEDSEPQAPPQIHEKDTEVIEFIYNPVCKSEQLNTEHAALSDTEAQHTTPPPEHAVPCTSTEPCGAVVKAVLCLPADFQTFTEPYTEAELAADGGATAPRRCDCKVCWVSFSDHRNLINHAIVHGDDCVCICGICGKLQPTREGLLEHLQRHVHVCECCGKTFSRQKDLSVHKRCHTGKKGFTCKVCGKDFSRKRDMEIHMKNKHTDEKPYRCSVCGKCFKVASHLILHSRSHSDPRYERAEWWAKNVSLQRFTGGLVVVESCDDSPKQNYNISDPEEALDRPEPSIKEEQEDEWSAGFEDSDPQALPQRHEKDTEVIKFIYSPVCKSEQLNPEPAALSDTEAQYTTPPPEDAVPCTSTEPCGAVVKAVLCLPADFQTFTEPYAEVELTVDGGATAPRPCHCKVCWVSFSDRSSLWNHVKNHGDDIVPKCGICGKKQPTRECLLEHLQIHVHVCECCGKTFSRQKDLRCHTARCHTGQHYTCKVCGKDFSRKRDMENHMNKHTDEKPYRCSVCGKCFKVASGLIRHSRSHSQWRSGGAVEDK